jgi:hypothetical protein
MGIAGELDENVEVNVMKLKKQRLKVFERSEGEKK